MTMRASGRPCNARGNRQAAASLLGISRTTLWRRLREMPNGEESPVAQ
ncbi:MAG: hypothetical protein IPI09_14890 [Burkholderiales bacterium]|nr:hypothetical protein [Burkholderiales bacterium]